MGVCLGENVLLWKILWNKFHEKEKTWTPAIFLWGFMLEGLFLTRVIPIDFVHSFILGESPVLRAWSEREGSAVARFLNGVLEWWSAGVLCKIPSSMGEQACLRIAMDKSSFQRHNLSWGLLFIAFSVLPGPDRAASPEPFINPF